MLQIVGKTSEGHIVVSGVYRFYETTGIPLDVILDSLRDQQMVPDWRSLVVEALEAGMRLERALALLEPAIVDSYGTLMRDVVIPRLGGIGP